MKTALINDSFRMWFEMCPCEKIFQDTHLKFARQKFWDFFYKTYSGYSMLTPPILYLAYSC